MKAAAINPVIKQTNYAGQKNYSQNKKVPTFNAHLYISNEAETLMKYQAYEASKGDNNIYKELIGGFGRFMEDLSSKVKTLSPENAALTVDLNPKLKEFMSLPPLTRGTYELDQLIIREGFPLIGGNEYWGYGFTYKNGNYSLLNQVFEGAKDVLRKAYH